uniref:RRM domain-containing protein n=1 Tax=Lepeophtheirus salmonis TaxID=72036 RepID=A0A0K2U9B3_LEPSM
MNIGSSTLLTTSSGSSPSTTDPGHTTPNGLFPSTTYGYHLNEHDKLSLSASVGSADEDLESGVGHSSDEDYYSSQDDIKEERMSTYVLNESFKVNVTGSEQWLCLAKLPMDLEEEEFENICSEFGGMKGYHLIRSDLTGKFKGYALVEYKTKSASIQAKHILDGHKLRGHTLEADWLTLDRVHETSLHSKCLFVDRLPTDYRDMGEFRKLFSSVVHPPYCQIAMKNGVIQNWGLVEFQRSQDAERTLLAMNGYEIIPGSKIRVQYCIPGVHAINVYMSFVNNPMDALSEKKALLEETPSTKVYDQLESLSKQNPWFVQSLQNIMAMNNGGDNHIKEPPKPPASKGDPAQAALVLLLAGSVVRSKENKSNDSIASLLQTVIKKLETGVSASNILKSFLPSSATDLKSFIADLLVKYDSSQKQQEQLSPPQQRSFFISKPPSPPQHHQTKDPTLTDLLLQSFQASISKGKCPQSSPPLQQTTTHSRGPIKTSRPVHKIPTVSKTLSPSNHTKTITQSHITSNLGLYQPRTTPSQTYAVYAAPQMQPYRPASQPIFSPATSFYPGLWPASRMSFPLNVVTAPQWATSGVMPMINAMESTNGSPYLAGPPVTYPAVVGQNGSKRKFESPFYGEALTKKVKLNEGV